MLHSQHICFSNVSNHDQKTIVNICDDLTIGEDDFRVKLNDTKMLVNIIGK